MRKARTHDEVLLWLNDRCRDHAVVTVAVNLDLGDFTSKVVEIVGALRFWRDLPGAPNDPQQLRDDILGAYAIGGTAVLDVTHLSPEWGNFAAHEHADGDLVIELAETITLSIHPLSEDERIELRTRIETP